MSSDRKITDAIRSLSGVKPDQVQLVAAEVVSVNVPNRTCIVRTTGGKATVEIENVKLMATVDDGVLFVPTLESSVLVAYSTYNLPFIALFSSLDKVLFIVGDSIVSVIDDLITLNDGSNGGLVKVIELTNKLNNLENKVNAIISAFNSHAHTGVQTGGGTSGVPASTISGTLTPTNRSEIENTKVTHG